MCTLLSCNMIGGCSDLTTFTVVGLKLIEIYFKSKALIDIFQKLSNTRVEE